MSTDNWTTEVYGVETETMLKLDKDKCVEFAIENNTQLKEHIDKVIDQYPPYDRLDVKREITEEFYNGIYSPDEEDGVYGGICEHIERLLGLDALDTTYMLVEHNDEGDCILGLLPIYPHLEPKKNLKLLSSLTENQINDAFNQTFRKLGVKLEDFDIDTWTLQGWS